MKRSGAQGTLAWKGDNGGGRNGQQVVLRDSRSPGPGMVHWELAAGAGKEAGTAGSRPGGAGPRPGPTREGNRTYDLSGADLGAGGEE